MDKNINPEIGQRIRELREKRGLSQKELADLTTTIDKTRISAYENAKRALDLHSLEQVAEALGTTLDFLIYGKGPRRTSYKKPSQKGAIIHELARLIDSGVIVFSEGKLYYNDALQIKEFVSQYVEVLNSYSKDKKAKLAMLEKEYVEKLAPKGNNRPLTADEFFTVMKNVAINMNLQEISGFSEFKEEAGKKETNKLDAKEDGR